MARAGASQKPTRIQREKRRQIFEAALSVFAETGLRGATLDQIAAAAGLSKPNLVYYFDSKEAIYTELLESLLEEWLSPLRDISASGEPMDEILTYVRRKIEMSRDKTLESRLFATEILQGAPRLGPVLQGSLKALVDEKATILADWAAEGRIAQLDPYHLIFSIWAMTQHYADFDTQVRALLGPDREANRFDEAETFLTESVRRMLQPDEE